MCRLLGIVGKRAVPVSECLTTAKRSLSVLSREHPDGWGIALHSRSAEGWRGHRSTERAHACGEFRRVAEEGAAEVVVAHVRQKTVGHTSIDNTHPFTRGRWVFAHNGTVRRIDVLEGRSSRRRLGEKGSDDVFEAEIRKQVELAIDEADVILFLVDVEEGITPMDIKVSKRIAQSDQTSVIGCEQS